MSVLRAHARLGPSAADRFMVCPGSVRLIERLEAEGRIDPKSSSGAADEGTAAHQVRSDALDFGLDAWDFVGTGMKVRDVRYECTEEMAGHLQPAMDWIREQPGDLIVEHRVDLSRWLPGQFGTLDTAILQIIDRRAIILDLKYGAGVPVDAFLNRQLRIYALGVVDNFDLFDKIDTILIVIDQPRAGGMKFWEITLEELLAFGEEVRAAGLAVDEPDAPLRVSEKGCKFCPVKDLPEGCPAYNQFQYDLFEGAFEDLDGEPQFKDTALIDPARRYYIVSHAHLATQWLGKLHGDSLDAAKNGNPDPGSKAVLGQRGDRKWSDPVEAELVFFAAAGEDAYTKKLLSPKGAEDLLKPGRKKIGNPTAWATLTALVTQDEGKPILAPVDDARPAITPLADMFEDLD